MQVEQARLGGNMGKYTIFRPRRAVTRPGGSVKVIRSAKR